MPLPIFNLGVPQGGAIEGNALQSALQAGSAGLNAIQGFGVMGQRYAGALNDSAQGVISGTKSLGDAMARTGAFIYQALQDKHIQDEANLLAPAKTFAATLGTQKLATGDQSGWGYLQAAQGIGADNPLLSRMNQSIYSAGAAASETFTTNALAAQRFAVSAEQAALDRQNQIARDDKNFDQQVTMEQFRDSRQLNLQRQQQLNEVEDQIAQVDGVDQSQVEAPAGYGSWSEYKDSLTRKRDQIQSEMTRPTIENGEFKEVPITTYSVGKSVGGADETEDDDTNQGLSSSGANLTPGVIATSLWEPGTILRNPNGYAFIVADSGNANKDGVDLYTDPAQYKGESGKVQLQAVGHIEEIPDSADGIREALSRYGKVPPGRSAEEFFNGSQPSPSMAPIGEQQPPPLPKEGFTSMRQATDYAADLSKRYSRKVIALPISPAAVSAFGGIPFTTPPKASKAQSRIGANGQLVFDSPKEIGSDEQKRFNDLTSSLQENLEVLASSADLSAGLSSIGGFSNKDIQIEDAPSAGDPKVNFYAKGPDGVPIKLNDQPLDAKRFGDAYINARSSVDALRKDFGLDVLPAARSQAMVRFPQELRNVPDTDKNYVQLGKADIPAKDRFDILKKSLLSSGDGYNPKALERYTREYLDSKLPGGAKKKSLSGETDSPVELDEDLKKIQTVDQPDLSSSEQKKFEELQSRYKSSKEKFSKNQARNNLQILNDMVSEGGRRESGIPGDKSSALYPFTRDDLIKIQRERDRLKAIIAGQ